MEEMIKVKAKDLANYINVAPASISYMKKKHFKRYELLVLGYIQKMKIDDRSQKHSI